MEISNRNNYKDNPIVIERQANSNYNKCMQSLNALTELSDNNIMLTNIDDMKNKFNKLIENGSIKESDITYIQLNGTIHQAINIQQKNSKNVSEIVDFYATYNNFNDIISRVR